jgi:DNA-binding response OmpR family regulator
MTYADAKRQLFNRVFDIVSLDLILPDGEGLDLVKHINTDKTKVIVLSRRDNVETRINSYRKGIDTYLGKPFYPEELLTLIQKSLNIFATTTVEGQNGLKLDIENKTLICKERKLRLSSLQTVILALLIRNNRVVRSEEIIAEIEGTKQVRYTPKKLAVTILRLRKKLDAKFPHIFKIETHYGTGYYLKYLNNQPVNS